MNRLRRTIFRLGLLSAALASPATRALAHSPAHHHAPDDAAPDAGENAAVRLPEVLLVDQNGTSLQLQNDVIGDRIVLVDFIYTTCTTVCPVVSAILSEVQTRLGEHVGRDVHLLSITVDPVRDTPARLRAYSRKHNAGDGWFWVTGTTERIAATLKGFGTWTPNFENHPPVIMVGDGRTGRWTRFYGFADPASLTEHIENLLASRKQSLAARRASPRE